MLQLLSHGTAFHTKFLGGLYRMSQRLSQLVVVCSYCLHLGERWGEREIGLTRIKKALKKIWQDCPITIAERFTIGYHYMLSGVHSPNAIDQCA